MYVQRSAPPPPKDVLARLGYQQIEALTKRCRQFEDTMKVAGTRHQGRRIQPIHCSLSHCRPAPEIWTLVPGGKFLFQVLRMPKETPGLEILVQDIDVHGAPRRLFCCQINPGEVGHYAVHPLSQTVRDEVRVFLFLVVAVRPFSTKYVQIRLLPPFSSPKASSLGLGCCKHMQSIYHSGSQQYLLPIDSFRLMPTRRCTAR